MDRYDRHRSLLTDEAWNRLCETTCVVAGVGGLGSTVVCLLARLAPLRLELWDPGIVDPPDLNRQLLFDSGDLGSAKVAVAKRRALQINPDVVTEGHSRALDADSFLVPPSSGPCVLFDCVDTVSARCEFEEIRQRRRVPIFHGAVQEWWGQVATLLPDGPGYTAVYGADMSSVPAGELSGRPIMPHVVTMVASAQVSQFVRYLEGEAIASPAICYIDGKALSTTHIGLGEVPV